MKKMTYSIRSSGGAGDVILSTPVFRALKEKDPDCKIVVRCVVKIHADIYRNNPHIDKLIMPSTIGNRIRAVTRYFKPAKVNGFEYFRLLPSISYDISAAEIIAEFVDLKLGNPKLQLYLTPEEERWGKEKMVAYGKPILIHISSVTSSNQHWPLSNWEELVRSLPEYTFVQLGLPHEEKVEGAIDLRGKTSFREALSLLNSSLSFVGVVSSFAHATNAFDTPGVVLFGPSTPKIWGHPNNINIYKGLPCAPCIDALLGSPCPYGKPCMTTITVDEVRKALLFQLEKKNSEVSYDVV